MNRFTAAAVTLAALFGCGGGFDEAAVLERVSKYSQAAFTRVNRDSASSVHMGAQVNVWVSSQDAASYRSVDTATGAAAPAFAPGAIIVKEQLNASGGVSALTVMAKGPRGYAAGSDDWYWAQTNPQGQVNGTFSGQVDFCISCHRPRTASDWAWGVPKSNQQ